MKENLHLLITYPENFPEELIEKDISELDLKNLNIQIEKQQNDLYSAMEWMVPTFLATYILKPYFDSFLAEAGKDNYQTLKVFCKKMLAKGKDIEAHLVPATLSTEKLSKTYSQSLAVSILVETKTKRQIKMLFDNNLGLYEWENAMEEFSNLITEHYENYPNDKLSNAIKDLSPKQYYTIYVKINPITKVLEFHDDHTLISESRM
ncbi:hypothetical protein [Flavobacterium chungangense]|uniref:Uncharacterized protein n=1 Tax=Flavobacterium chungangense TaxID=554283 RepID=A0A6V6ZDS1_9FLAO|nr:hypothetical protein [Flavobacterium chungangense]CAD0009696.1 hypothetical protein FLACHUCJ7_04361 [Flavobacterium chungangense]